FYVRYGIGEVSSPRAWKSALQPTGQATDGPRRRPPATPSPAGWRGSFLRACRRRGLAGPAWRAEARGAQRPRPPGSLTAAFPPPPTVERRGYHLGKVGRSAGKWAVSVTQSRGGPLS